MSNTLNSSTIGLLDDLRRLDLENSVAVADPRLLPVDDPTQHSRISRISAVRRTFLITGAFDVILSFLIWVIFSQISYHSLNVAFSKEVMNYTFQGSAFDTVFISFGRCLILEVAYGLIISNTVWWVALTTLSSSAFLLVKVFFYDFNLNPNALNYFLFLVAFTLSWVELWMLDFKVLRTEKKETERLALDDRIRLISSLRIPDYAAMLQTRASPFGSQTALHPHNSPSIAFPAAIAPNERRRGTGRSNADQSEYYSVDSPDEPSDDEDNERDRAQTEPGDNGNTRQEPAAPLDDAVRVRFEQFNILVKRTVDRMWKMYMEESGWRNEVDTTTSVTESSSANVVDSRVFDRRRYFRLRTVLDASLYAVVDEMFAHIESSVTWNSSLKFARRIEVYDTKTDVIYTVSNEAVGGLISSREFLSLRHIDTRRLPSGVDVTVLVDTPVDHPLVPALKQYVRGENGPSAMFFRSVTTPGGKGTDGECTELTWLFYCDVKGWVPRSAVETNMAKTMLTVVDSLRMHLTTSGRSSRTQRVAQVINQARSGRSADGQQSSTTNHTQDQLQVCPPNDSNFQTAAGQASALLV